MSNERIAFFFSSLHVGGIERIKLNLASAFIARGVQVDLVLVKAEGSLRSHVPSNARLINLNSRRTLFALRPLLHYLRAEQPRVMLSSQTHNNVLAIWARRLSGFPNRLAVCEHINMQEMVKYSPLRDRFRPLVARKFYPYADVIIAVSNGVAKSLSTSSRIPLSQIHVIYNPIELADIEEKSQGKADHPWLQSKTEPVVIAVGRLTKQKDYSTLINAISILRRHRSIRLVILGEGEQRNTLMQLIRELKLESDVSLPGYIDNPLPYMHHADIFALSSKWEGLPNVLIEALACGVPIVATNCPSGPAEILDGGKYGKLIPVGNAQALADAIDATLEAVPAREMLQERARHFSMQKIVDQYLQLLLM